MLASSASRSCSLIVASLLMWPLRGHVTDDTFIHLQYARHLAQGQGLVFNSGRARVRVHEPAVDGADRRRHGARLDGLITARVLGFLATLVSIPLFLQLMRRTRPPARAARVRDRGLGVRTRGCCAGRSRAWRRRSRSRSCSRASSRSPKASSGARARYAPERCGRSRALARPEAVFLLVLWGLLLLVDTNNRDGVRRMVFGIVPPLVIYGAWLLFARLYFGSFWPRTLTAKRAGAAAGVRCSTTLRQLPSSRDRRRARARCSCSRCSSAASRVGPGWTDAQRALPWMWLIALPLLYVARGVPPISRYLLVLLPVLAWLALAGRGHAGGRQARRHDSPPRRVQATVIGLS